MAITICHLCARDRNSGLLACATSILLIEPSFRPATDEMLNGVQKLFIWKFQQETVFLTVPGPCVK